MKQQIVLLLFFFIIVIACGIVDSPDNPRFINGRVFDESGKPIEDAIIEINYNLTSVVNDINFKILNTNAKMASFVIHFAVPQRSFVKLWISHFNKPDTVKLLINTEFLAGMYHFIWDGTNHNNKKVISNIYQYHLQIEQHLTSKAFLMLNDYNQVTNLNNLQYIAKTNGNGYYEINQSELAFNYDTTFELTDEHGNPLGVYKLNHYIDLWSLHQNYFTTHKESLYVNPTQGAQVNFTMIKK